jgi:hypothetical protein
MSPRFVDSLIADYDGSACSDEFGRRDWRHIATGRGQEWGQSNLSCFLAESPTRLSEAKSSRRRLRDATSRLHNHTHTHTLIMVRRYF